MKIAITLLFLVFNLFAQETFCELDTISENDSCLVRIDDIKPTQFSLGMIAIADKVKKMEKSYKKNKLHKKIIEKVIPTVIGPDQRFYILDGHHSSYALLNADIPLSKKYIFANITKDCSKCSYEEFYSLMSQEGNSYLLDKNFKKRYFYELPKSLTELQDNPYRSLSFLMREKDCFFKVNVNFLEFIWAKAIKEELDKENIFLTSSNEEDLNSLLDMSCDLAKDKKFASLPGYAN